MLLECESDAVGLTNIFCEFIETAIHNILYTRKLYPDSIFEPKRKYGVVVYHSVHPSVNEYILHCVETISFHLRRNQLRGTFLCINSAEIIVEKYYFKVLQIDACIESDPFLTKIEECFNNFCLKLYSSISTFNRLPDNCSFSIQLETSKYATLEYSQELILQDFSWVEINKSESNLAAKIIPLHNIQAGFLIMQTYIEQLSQTLIVKG